MTLGGNVEARVLANESLEVVEEATGRALEGGKHRRVLRTSEGPFGRMTPNMVANFHQMIGGWEELSPL